MHPAAPTPERHASAPEDGAARHRAIQLLVGLAVGIGVLLGWSAASSAQGTPSLGTVTGTVSGAAGTADGVVDPAVQALPPAPAVPTAPAVPAPPAVVAPPALPAPPLPPAPGVPPVIDAPAPSLPPVPGPVTPPALPGEGGNPVLPIEPVIPPAPPVLPPGVEPSDLVVPGVGSLRPDAGAPFDLAGAAAPGLVTDPSIEAVSLRASVDGLALPAPAGDLPDGAAAPAAASGAPSGTDLTLLSASPASSETGGSHGPAPTSAPLPVCGAGASVDRAPQGTPPSSALGGNVALARTGAQGRVHDGDVGCSSIPRVRPAFAPD